MATVKVYDQYLNVHLDNNTGNLVTLENLRFDLPFDSVRYTLVHSNSSIETILEENLTSNDAKNLVNSKYLESKTLGTSYIDKNIKLDEGYAELIIDLEDGKRLKRIIYLKEEN